MALTSPGVQVSVIDESFYTPAEPGTRPLFIVATAANKTNGAGTGTAQGTLAANAGTVYLITSQRDLVDTFGDPVFKVDSNNNPIHAGEQNEYGLQAAYSYLGVSNSAFVVRADLDLTALDAQADAPAGEPLDGSFWLDTSSTAWGVFEWNGRSAVDGGQMFTSKTPVYAATLPTTVTTGGYVVSSTGNVVSIYYGSPYAENGVSTTPTWVKVGSAGWAAAHGLVQGTAATGTGRIDITPNDVLDDMVSVADISGLTLNEIADAINSAAGVTPLVGARVVGGKLVIFAASATVDTLAITNTGATALGIAGTFKGVKTTLAPHTSVPQYKVTAENRPTGSVWIKTTEPNAGASWRVNYYNSETQLWELLTTPLYATGAAALAALDPTGAGANLTINTVYAQYNTTGAANQVADFVVNRWNPTTSAWVAMPVNGDSTDYYFISNTAPTSLTADNTLWYSSVVDEVDFLVLDSIDGVATWVGLNNHPDYTDAEVFVSASQPELDNTQKNIDKHLWIDTSDLENYPNLKRWSSSFKRWDAVDASDQTTENGIVFADARWATVGSESNPSTIAALRTSNFVDFDAPDPALYPQGMLLWNLRRSGFNVKKFVRNYIDTTARNGRYNDEIMTSYYPHRWVTESGNQNDGSGSFGRHAQRKVVIQALQALVNSNEEMRDTEVRTFNLLACPGYPELIGEMVSLNYDRGLTAFVVGDTPARLLPNATSINNWGNNVAASLQDDDNGLVSFDEYLGVFYPWGFSSDNAGRDIVVPPSHMILRMIALNDQVAYPWFAPAGTRRGGITNATNVGYVTAEGEFKAIALNEGQRDTLYNVKVNPITYFTGAGLVNFGQKTRAKNASALDRINVARLVIYLRSQLNKLAKPYIFEPNDKITRDEIKQQVESLLLELVGQRALYDFLVVCDESNNTPNRIDRNELYVDIAIEPVKAVEFIYIPVRLKNTGEIAGLG